MCTSLLANRYGCLVLDPRSCINHFIVQTLLVSLQQLPHRVFKRYYNGVNTAPVVAVFYTKSAFFPSRISYCIMHDWPNRPEAHRVAQAMPCYAAFPLSEDHKPNRTDERQRIESAGGVVVWAGTWRVGGVLAVSRAFGELYLSLTANMENTRVALCHRLCHRETETERVKCCK